MVLLLVLPGRSRDRRRMAGQASKRRELAKRESELEPVKRLAEEDVTALGVELQDLDIELAGTPLGR